MEWSLHESTKTVLAFQKHKNPNVERVYGPQLCLADAWQSCHKQYDVFQHKFNINNTSRCIGDFESDIEYMHHLEEVWKQWLCNVQIEIASNFGIQATDSIGQTFAFNETSLSQHYQDTQTIQHSSCNKLRAHSWALRRVPEIKALCSRESDQWTSFHEHRHLGSKLNAHAKSGHLDIGYSLAKDIEVIQSQHHHPDPLLWEGLKETISTQWTIGLGC